MPKTDRRAGRIPHKTLADVLGQPPLSQERCPKCNSRMRHPARHLYYCSHCKKHYRVVLEVIKSKLVPA